MDKAIAVGFIWIGAAVACAFTKSVDPAFAALFATIAVCILWGINGN